MNKTSLIAILLFLGLRISVSGQVLNVATTMQEQGNWCWDACSACILKYNCTPLSQCEIANYALAMTNCCNVPSGCNYQNTLYAIQDILVHFANISSQEVGVVLDKAAIHATLQQNRPFVIFWYWTSGGGHVIIGHGLVGNDLYYMDPLQGLKIADYSWVCSNAAHTWIDTQVLTTSPSGPWPAGDISGPSAVQCQASVRYTVPSIPNATAYIWSFTPPEAGSITPTGNSALLDVNKSFSGYAALQVKGSNSCADGTVSPILTIRLNSSKPLKAATPAGPVLFCSNPANTQYTTSATSNASMYVWELTPADAGVITGTWLTATVDWNDSFIGTATLTVTGTNDCGDGPASDPLTISIGALPLQSAKPTGKTKLCVNPANENYYTSGADNSTSYFWDLLPSTAGEITGTSSSAVVNWNDSFTGTATISVTGRNSCGDGTKSKPLTVEIHAPPVQAAAPLGPITICAGIPNSTYSTGSINASSYVWMISPSNAGSIVASDTSAVVTWNSSFTGAATMSVKGSNDCGDGPVSDFLNVTVSPLPGQPETPAGTAVFCQSTTTTTYTTKPIQNATSCLWSISPPSAGMIKGAGFSASVEWDGSFAGEATIFVRGRNDCGDGGVSVPLVVKVIELPAKASAPAGTTVFCTHPTSTRYVTSGASNAVSYKWTLTPPVAGSIIGADTAAMVDWNKSYTGIATIKVTGHNTCGDGAGSDPLYVSLNPLPDQPATPTGAAALCVGSTKTLYTTARIANATSYSWTIIPAAAGTITGNDTAATVDWKQTFTGTAAVAVQSHNNCGDGLVSKPLYVFVKRIPGQAIAPEGASVLCKGTGSALYSTARVADAESYHWDLSPKDAGTISSRDTSATVTWFQSYSGPAAISVKANNECGEGSASPPKSVLIAPLPVLSLGNDTSMTLADTIILNAGAGFKSYVWNDKSTRQTFAIIGSVAGIGTHQYSVTVANADDCLNTDTVFVSILDPTGTDRPDMEETMYVYPNPANGVITIKVPESEFRNATMEVVTMDGRRIYSRVLDGSLSQINIADLPKGMYLVKFTSSVRMRISKLVIE
jgi:hypothetical protein